MERPAWANPWWGLSSATVEANLDPERRWAATAIGNGGAGRQSGPARGRDGTQPDLGRGLSGFLVRVPAGAQPAGCIGRAVGRDRTQESELGAGLGHSIIFRQNRTWVDGQVRGASDRRQSDRAPDPEMAEGGRDGGRPVVRDGGRDATGGGDIAGPCQSLPAPRTRSVGKPVAEAGSDGRCDHRAVRRRRRTGVSASGRSQTVSGAAAGTGGEVRAGATPGEDAPDRVQI